MVDRAHIGKDLIGETCNDEPVLVTMNLETSQPSILKSLVENKLTRFEDLKVVAVDKRNAVIDCPASNVALEVAALL